MKWRLFVAVSLIIVAAEGAYLAWANNIPSVVTTTAAALNVSENAYRWYSNINALDPISPAAAENASIDTPSANTQVRLRMNVGNTGGLALPAGTTFTLQYANSTSGPWTDVETSTAWIFFDNPSVADGQIIVSLLLSQSTVGESYGESNPSAAMPSQIFAGDFGEWDWSLLNLSADTSQNWFFRMIYSSGTAFDAYTRYPKFTGVTPPPPPPPPGGGSGGGQGNGGGTGYQTTSTTSTGPGATSTGTSTSKLPQGPPLLPPEYQRADFNGDNRIGLADLSILLYYYHRSDTIALRYDLNEDSTVNFPDVSILMFYWTAS